jgi:hypothetical protein
MPNIIYQKTPGQLIAQGDRTVSTFPSGLIRVDQSFICATADAASQRALLQVESNFPGGNEPAIDGIYVYPEIQEKRQSDGFTEFIVSGYGRTQITLQNEQKRINTIQTVAFIPFAIPGSISTKGIYISNNVVSGYVVIEKNEGLDVDGLGFATDYFNRYNIISYISDVQTKIISSETRPYGFYVDWNGDLKNKSLSRIGMQFSNTSGEFVDSDVYYYQYTNPIITVINRNNCGKFIELEIEVQ